MVAHRNLILPFILTVLFISFSSASFSQIRFPKEFKLVKDETGPVGYDEYTNGRYSFDRHRLFVEVEYKPFNDSVKNFLSNYFGFPFHITKDGLYWGTGKANGLYSYVVITWESENIELYSQHNDSGFSYYSKWLLATIRDYRKKGKSSYFPWSKNDK
jgi:hypothetical protein